MEGYIVFCLLFVYLFLFVCAVKEATRRETSHGGYS